MRFHIALRPQIQQRVHDSAVGQIHFRRAHLSLGQVFVPRLQLPHDKRGGQMVEISPDRRVRSAKRPRIP